MLAAMLSALRRQPEQAWMAVDQALRVDPLGARDANLVARGGVVDGRFRTSNQGGRPADRRASRLQRCVSLAFDGVTVRGEYDRARADLETFGALTNTQLFTLVGLGIVAALEGKTAEARGIIDVMMERSEAGVGPPMAFGQVEQQLGNYDAALDWYERAYQTRDFMLTVLARRSSV